jgi:hypothetical protein
MTMKPRLPAGAVWGRAAVSTPTSQFKEAGRIACFLFRPPPHQHDLVIVSATVSAGVSVVTRATMPNCLNPAVGCVDLGSPIESAGL